MSVRNYFVPRAVAVTAPRAVAEPLVDHAIQAAGAGRVSCFQLPLLASSGWRAGSEWATQVLERESESESRRAEALLAAAGYDPDAFTYYGVLDPGHPDQELIVSVAREPTLDGEAPLEKWDGLDWGTAEVDPDGLRFVVLDRDVLADVLTTLDAGSSGLMLRPFQPKAWTRGAVPEAMPVLAAGPPAKHTGVMVAFYPDEEIAEALAVPGGEPYEEIHLTLAYLGDTEEKPIDYQAIQRAVAKWARRMSPVAGEIAGTGLFTAGPEPVTYASVDCPELPEARQMLVKILESEGVQVARDHGYTPHMTLAYDDVDVDVANFPLRFERVVVKYGDDTQIYDLGTPVIAAGGAGPDTVYAIVDEFDTSAVLDLVRVVPGPIAYRRSGGKWIKDQKLLIRLMGVDPPPVAVVREDQLQSVLSQVDAYDKENPEPVVAAVPWDEKKFKRGAGGKFTNKTGQPQSKGRIRDLTDRDVGLGPRRPPRGGGRGPSGPRGGPRTGPFGPVTPAGAPGGAASGPRNPQTIREKPWTILGNKGQLDAGLPDSFWRRQPPGFHDWLGDFLRQEARGESGDGEGRGRGRGRDGKGQDSDDGRNEKGERKGTAGDNKRDVAKGGQRSRAQVEAQKKAASKGGQKSGAKNLADFWSRVPPRYRKAMHDFIDAAVAKADRPRQKAERRRQLARRDREYDLKFAQEGLGESRRRELFDRQVGDQARRLGAAGIKAQSVESVMRKKVAEEKRRREDFERRRRLQAEQERVRRMRARHAEADWDDDDARAMTAASMMPAKLKKYWVAGEGRAKIRWGTSGDFDRCVRNLSKYLGAHQVKGACANLHKLATGQWPGKGREH